MSGKLNDSPWFWLLMFGSAAVAALAVIGPKHVRRQERLVRMQAARERLQSAAALEKAAQSAAGPDGSQPRADDSAQPAVEPPHVSVRPLMVFLAAALFVAALVAGWIQVRRAARAPWAASGRVAWVSSFFFERPLALLFCGIGLEVALGVALWLSGKAALLRAMLAVLMLTLLAIGVERLVVTDREQIDALLDHGVQAVLARDTPGVMAIIDTSAAELRRTVTQMLARGHVEELKITHQEVAVHSGARPRTATVHLIARIKAQLPAAAMPQGQGLLPAVLELRKTDGWKITRADFEPRALPKAVGS